MSSPKRIILGAVRKSSPSRACLSRGPHYSTYLQTTTQPMQSITNLSSTPPASAALASPLSKSSHVQQMWFHGHLGSTRLSKEELSQNIAAMLDDDNKPADSPIQGNRDGSSNITLLVGELLHSSPSPDNPEIQINSVKLSNICSPRTVYSGRMKHFKSDLRGRKVVVAVLNNLSIKEGKGSFSEGVILCDRTGQLIDPGHSSRIGGQVRLVGNGQILKHLQFSDTGFANLSHGQLSGEDGHILRPAQNHS